MLTIDKFNSNKKVDRTQNSVSILIRRKLPSTSLGKNERQNENPNTKEKKIKAREKQPIEASIGIYSLFINGFLLTFLFVCSFVCLFFALVSTQACAGLAVVVNTDHKINDNGL